MNEEVEEKTEAYKRPFIPNHVLDEIGVIFLVIGIILIIASLRRPEEHYLQKILFVGVIQMTDFLFPLFALLVILALIAYMVFLPFLDRSEERHPRKRLVWVLIMLAFIGLWLVFTVMGF